MADSESVQSEASSPSMKTPLLIIGSIMFILILAGVGIYLATKSTPSPNTPSPITPSPNTPSPNTPSPYTPSPNTPSPNTPSPNTPFNTKSPVNTTSPNTKSPPKGGNLPCQSDSDCVNFGNKTYCNLDMHGCDLPPAPCNINSDCKDSQKPFCNQNFKTCVNALDPCMPLLGDTWFSSDTWGCVPSCINNDKGRSHSGWCKADSKAECPQDGWDIRSVIGNPDGNNKGGKQESTNVCAPVEAKGAPYNWIYDGATKMFVPQCKVDKKFRDEGYCVADTDTDCTDGYTRIANKYPNAYNTYVCNGKGKNQ